MEKMALSNNQQELLDQLYYHDIVSFRGVNNLYSAAKDKDPTITLALVKQWLKSQPTYTIHKPIRKHYKRNKIQPQFTAELFQFDLADMLPPEVDNETGKKYNRLFIGIDSYSRVAFAIPLINRKSQDIIDAMQEIINSGYKPDMALCDPAGEHVSGKTKKYFESQGIHLYHTASVIHAPQAERLIRDLRNFVRRYQEANNTNKWLVAAQQFIYNHNRIITRAHGEIPLEVMNDPEANWRAFEKLYGTKIKKPNRNRVIRGPNVDSTVRLSRLKHPFEKESTHNWTKEIFTVSRIDKNKERPMYQLKDTKNELVRGKAYPEEIQEIEPESDQFYEIEKILNRRKIRGLWYCRVKWKGYSNKFNTWVPQKDVQALNKGHRNIRYL